MNRRKAVGILLAGIGGGCIYPAMKLRDWYKSPDYQYLDENKPLIAALAECIIPATDTPGARDSGTHEFIVAYVKDCADHRSANTFIEGLNSVQSYCISEYNSVFENCNPNNQVSALTHFQEKGKPWKGIVGKAQQRYLGKSFFTLLKEYTVQGYCTSELGATRGLAYMPVPGAYHGQLQLQSGQRGWATK